MLCLAQVKDLINQPGAQNLAVSSRKHGLGLPGLCSLRVHRDLGTGYKLGLINADKGLVSVMLP